MADGDTSSDDTLLQGERAVNLGKIQCIEQANIMSTGSINGVGEYTE